MKEFRPKDLISVSEAGEKIFTKTIIKPLLALLNRQRQRDLLSQTFQPRSLRYEQLEYLGDAVLHLEITKKQLAVSGLMSGPGILSQERSSYERREPLAIVFDDLDLGKFMPDLTPEFFSVDRWKRKCDCVEALLGEVFEIFENMQNLPPATVNGAIAREIQMMINLLVEAIIYRGKQLLSNDEVKGLHAKAKENKWKYC